MTDAWQIIQGDCLDVMRGMPDASVDAVLIFQITHPDELDTWEDIE